MEDLKERYITSGKAAELLRVKRITVSQLCHRGTIPAEKVANRWFIPRAVVEELAKTYVPKRGRPRQKRKYTRRQT